MYCQNCGQEIVDGMETCPFCNSTIEYNKKKQWIPYYKRQKPKYKPSIASSIISTIFLIIGIILVVMAFRSTFDLGKNWNQYSSSQTDYPKLTNIFGYSTEEIAKEAQKLIENDWKNKGINATVLEDMLLTKKGGNEYSGMMKIMYEGKTIQYTGTVICDGKSIQWLPDTQNLFYQLLY